MSDLKLAEFQRAAVETICDRLMDHRGSRRFLLADEVGLGKTVVARGVIEELLRRHRRKDLNVVYLCSNSEIADQNRTKLASDAPPSVHRITQLAWSESDGEADRLQLYSFTPGTSLSAGTGMAWERRLLLYLSYRILRIDILKGKWRDYFQCGMSRDSWRKATRFSVLKAEFSRKLRPGLQDRIAEEWRIPAEIGGATVKPLTVIRDEVARFDLDDPESRRRRNKLVGVLRTGAQRALLDALEPDLVILDEVQRFREVIEEAGSKKSIAARLFKHNPAVLILSATPYRMLSLDHEGHGHYEEFLDTVEFLFADRGKVEVNSLREDLNAFRERLEAGSFLQGNDPELLILKSRIETRLRKVICRTERNAYIQDPTKGIQEIRPTGDKFVIPQEREVVDFIRLRRFLLDKVDTSQHITEYWKSCPAPFTFMDAQYAPMAAAKQKRAVVPSRVVEPPSRLGELAQRNLRFRELFQAVFGAPETPWKFLWTRPSYTYYRDEFFEDVDPAKMLVFSGWRFVPKAIALLTSHEAEQRIAPHSRLWEAEDRPPLRFTEKGSYHIFDLCFPSPALAQIVEPSSFAGEELTAKEVLKRTRKALKEVLMKARVMVADTSRSPLWQVVARLEEQTNTSVDVRLKASSSYRGEDTTERFKEHVNEFVEWMNNHEPLRISEERLTHLARIVAFSPAIALLRAFWSTFPTERGQVPMGVVDLCFGALRSYFNRRTVRAIVERNTESPSYARAIIEYCERAHFQAVADEYLYVGKNVLQRNTPGEMAEHLARVLGIGTGSPNINLTTDTGRLSQDQFTGRAHFALAFGEDLKSDQESHLEQSGPSRKTAVREAFNSPFWPFVLATTSVGQEGLDFHLFCRDVVHWNLPSNPVDLEQREGRINRRDGLAVRRAIAREWPIKRLAETPTKKPLSFSWEHVFDAVSNAPDIQRYKHGLYPHWVFEPKGGQVERIRRHLFFYADSQDASRYEEVKERLALYRLVFGQPRQQDLLDRIQRMARGEPEREVSPAALTRYMINLSPLGEAHAVARAALEADEVAGSAEKLKQLLLDVEQIEIERSAELLPISHELDQLKAIVRQQLKDSDQNGVQLTIAVRALIYLRDPYDAVMDQHINLGLDDDLGRIRFAARELAGNTVG